MQRQSANVLEVESREKGQVIVLTLQSFFIGIFISTFEISSTSLFLEYFSQSDLPIAFVISGVVGIIITTIFSQFQRFTSFAILAILNLLVISGVTVALRLGFQINDTKSLVYVIFVLMGPLKVVAYLGFWGIASRVFSLRQGKRLFSLIDSGQVFGAILIGFSTSLIMKAVGQTENLLILSAGSAIISLVIQFFISFKYSTQIKIKVNTQEEDQAEKNTHSYGLFSNAYVRYMIIFVILSMISVFFVYNSFLSVAKDQFPKSEDLTNFLGFFVSMVMIFSFLFKTFLYSRIVQMYGLKVILLILPILLLGLTVASALIGSFLGYTLESSVNFTLFFILIALSQLFTLSLKNAVEVPAFKILYQPLPRKIRYDIQAKIDGIVNESAAVIAGLLLMALSTLKFIQLIHFSYALILILGAWAFVTIKLYQFYKQNLKYSLAQSSSNSEHIHGEARLKSRITSEISKETPEKIKRSLTFTASYEPNLFESFLIDLLKNENEDLQIYALDKVKQNRLLSLRSRVKAITVGNGSDLVKSKAKEILNDIDKTDHEVEENHIIDSLSSSKIPEDRVVAAKLLGEIGDFDNKSQILNNLLKDFHPKVRKAAIATSAKVNLPELWPRMIDNLAQSDYSQSTTSAIIAIGEKILPTLEQAFYKSGYSAELKIEIIRIYGIIGGEDAQEYLLKKLSFPDGRVVRQTLLALRLCDYTAETGKISSVNQAIEDTIGNILWNLAAVEEINSDEIGSELRLALNDEIDNNYEYLYLLLSLAYDAQSIKYVQENIQSGMTERIGYAIELLDIFVAEDLKPKLFPLLEDISLSEKIRLLEPYFPRTPFDQLEIIRQIINRNYNSTNRWTKACAIMSLLKIPNANISNDLIANIFNQDRLLRESSAWVLYQLDEPTYHEATDRIDAREKSHLDGSIIKKSEYGHPLLYDLTLIISSFKSFDNIGKFTLCQLAEKLNIAKSLNGETILEQNSTDHNNLYFIRKGNVVSYQNGEIDLILNKGHVFSSLLWDKESSINAQFLADSEVEYYVLKEQDLFDLMNRHNSLAHAIYTMAKEGHSLQANA